MCNHARKFKLTSHLLIQMLAPAYQLSARDPIAPAYQLSALDHSQVIVDQTFYFSLSVSRRRSLPLQRLSSAASERPQKNRRTFCDDKFTAASGPGRARGPSCDEPPTNRQGRGGRPEPRRRAGAAESASRATPASGTGESSTQRAP